MRNNRFLLWSILVCTIQPLLIILRLTNVIRFSWWLVYTPSLILYAAFVVMLVYALAVSASKRDDF